LLHHQPPQFRNRSGITSSMAVRSGMPSQLAAAAPDVVPGQWCQGTDACKCFT